AVPFRYRHVPWQLAPPRRTTRNSGLGSCAPLRHAGQADVLQQFGFHESSQRESPRPRWSGAQWPVSGAGDGRVHRVSGVLPLANDLPAGRLQQLLGGGDGAGGGVVGVHVHAGVGLVDDPVAEAVDGGLLVVLVLDVVADHLPLDHRHVAVPVGHDVRRGGDGGDVAVRVAELLGVAVPGEAVGLVDLGGELGGEGVVQVLAVGVLVEGGGVGEDAGAALGGGALRENLDDTVDVDDEDGQVGELGLGELTDVRGSNEAHSYSSRIVPGAAPRGGGSGAVPLTS